MKAKKGRRAMAAALAVPLLSGLLGLFGCRDEEPVPVDGGTTTHIDANAPKEIESTELAEFSVRLYLATRYRGDEIREFDFEIKKGEDGSPRASEKLSGISAPADEALLSGLEGIIRRFDLAANNGVYRVTAGLPPEFEAHTFRAVYASGEEITFTENNDEFSAWGEAIYDLFADWFAARGDETLRPAKEASLLTRLDFDLKQNGRTVSWGGINVGEEDAIDGETYLLEKRVYNWKTEEIEGWQFRLFPADHYERLSEIIAASDLERRYAFSYYDREAGNFGNHDEGYYGWGAGTTADGEEDSEDFAIDLYLEYESGRRMNVETKKMSEIEAMRPLTDALAAYFESLFQ